MAASVTATLSMSSAAPPTLIATTAATPTIKVINSSTTGIDSYIKLRKIIQRREERKPVSAAPPTLIADSLPTTSTTKSAVSEVSSLATSTSTAMPIAESTAPPITESAVPPTTTSAVSNYADQNKPVVKGPAGIIQSHEEANNFYMNNYFPGWWENYITYTIPPVYEINHEEKPNEIIFQNKKRQVSDYRRSQLAEESVVYAFYNYGCKHAQPMFIFHGVKLGKSLQQQHGKKKNNSGESDIIIVHREIGIILVETKAMEKFNNRMYNKKAKDQLNDAEKFVIKTIELGQHARRVPVFKVIACPKLKRHLSQNPNQHIDLCMEDLSKFDQWWKKMIESASIHSSIALDTVCYSLIQKLIHRQEDDFLSGMNGPTEKAVDSHMNNKFPGWKKNLKTHTIKMHSKEVVSDDYRSQLAAEAVVYAFHDYGYNHAQPMFIFHGVKFDENPQQQKPCSEEDHTIIIHRKIGVILVETKRMEKFNEDTYKDAKEQLNDAEQFLKTICIELDQHATAVPVFKVVACPKLCKYIDLRMEDLSKLDDWWKNTIGSPSTDPSTLQLCNIVYCNLIPKLLCGRDDICLPLKIKAISDKLDNQEVRKKVNEPEMNVPYERENNGTSVEECIYLTPEQCRVWHKERQVICGPFGSGKTVLIQCKAAHLANDGESVLVIVPLHLIPGYKKFFEETVMKDSKPQLISRVELYEHFDKYKTSAQSSHVFIDELLWPYSPDELPESEDEHERDRRKIHVFELLQILMNENNQNCVWIAPHLFAFVNLSYFKPSDVIEGMSTVFLAICMLKRFPISRLTNIMRTSKQINDLKVKQEQDWLGQPLLKIIGEFLDNFTLFLDKFPSFLTNCLASLSSPPSLSCLAYVASLSSPPSLSCLACVASLSSPPSLSCLAYVASLSSSPSLSCYVNKIRELRRQQGQIVSGESWSDEGTYEALKNKFPDHLYYITIIQPLFRNTLGHCVAGPPVKTITYPTHCCNYDVHDKLPNETSKFKEHFHHFFAKALKAEIEVLLREPPELKESTKKIPLQASDIAIIKDFQDDNLNLDHDTHNIKTLLHDAGVKTCTVTKQQGGTNEVAICESCDIASLEWSVVFHVSSTERSRSSIDRSIHGESLIISRAKVQYILLYVSEDHYHDLFRSIVHGVGRSDIVKK